MTENNAKQKNTSMAQQHTLKGAPKTTPDNRKPKATDSNKENAREFLFLEIHNARCIQISTTPGPTVSKTQKTRKTNAIMAMTSIPMAAPQSSCPMGMSLPWTKEPLFLLSLLQPWLRTWPSMMFQPPAQVCLNAIALQWSKDWKLIIY